IDHVRVRRVSSDDGKAVPTGNIRVGTYSDYDVAEADRVIDTASEGAERLAAVGGLVEHDGRRALVRPTGRELSPGDVDRPVGPDGDVAGECDVRRVVYFLIGLEAAGAINRSGEAEFAGSAWVPGCGDIHAAQERAPRPAVHRQDTSVVVGAGRGKGEHWRSPDLSAIGGAKDLLFNAGRAPE